MSFISRRHITTALGGAGALSIAGLWGLPANGQAQAPPAMGSPVGTGTGKLQSWKLNTPRRTGIHDLAPAPGGGVWFTGQSGFVGKVAVKTGQANGQVSVQAAPRGRGPYGICATPSGDVWWCSLAGSFIARIDRRTGESVVVEPPTAQQGARRVWSDSQGRIWVSEWNSGNLSVHDPAATTSAGRWRTWKMPGDNPRAYAVYVDVRDIVWVTEWTHNTTWSFDPRTEKFERYVMPREGATVRQILGRAGEVWLPESGTEHISVIYTG